MQATILNTGDFIAAWNAAGSRQEVAAQFEMTDQQASAHAYRLRGMGHSLKKCGNRQEVMKCKECGREFRSYPSCARQYCNKKCSDKHANKRAKTHGESRTRLHGIWCHMKTRCYCPTSKAYSYYGGRGISVCQEWRDSFEVFRDWAMENGYQDDLEIDRREVNGNYEPGNCRWATRVQQMRNTRKKVDAKSSRFKGVSRTTCNGRITKWRVQLHCNSKPVHIGVFDDEVSAAKAYDAAAKKYYGDFASLNFPETQGSESCHIQQVI